MGVLKSGTDKKVPFVVLVHLIPFMLRSSRTNAARFTIANRFLCGKSQSTLHMPIAVCPLIARARGL
jgi:hypothetical protein